MSDSMSVEWFHNQSARHGSLDPFSPDVRVFHQSLEGYKPTELIKSVELAKDFGVKNVFLKIENSRFGLPAFKGLGASWAVKKAIEKYGDQFQKL